MSDKPVVLFLCLHNSGRSLAATVLLDHYAAGRVEVRSAGTEPGDTLNPAVVAVLGERGVDTAKEFPKPLTDADARAADVVVTMGCGDTCPWYPGKRYVDWDLTDPAGLPPEEVRPIIDDIDRRVQALLGELVAPSIPTPPRPGPGGAAPDPGGQAGGGQDGGARGTAGAAGSPLPLVVHPDDRQPSHPRTDLTPGASQAPGS